MGSVSDMKRLIILGILAIFLISLASPAVAQEEFEEAVEHAVLEALELYTIATIATIVQVLLIATFSLHIGRPYFIRILKKYTLRLGADIWWTTYILARDGTLLISFLLGFVYFYPDAMTEVKFAVPWYNIAIVFVALTLLLKLVKDTDEDPKAHSLAVLLVTLATLVHTGGTVFIFEAAHGTPLDWSVEGGFWDNLRAMFRSTSNLGLAAVTFWVTFALLGFIALVALIYIFTGKEKE